MKTKIILLLTLFFAGCLGASVKRDLFLPQDFQPQDYRRLAVINADPQIKFSEYVEAVLIQKGYKVKEGSIVRQALKNEGIPAEEPLDLKTLSRVGKLLDVQGIVLCSVLEFSRFRDSFRLNIKMVSPESGNTVWSAQGSLEGRRGQKTSDLLKEISVSALKKLPSAPKP